MFERERTPSFPESIQVHEFNATIQNLREHNYHFFPPSPAIRPTGGKPHMDITDEATFLHIVYEQPLQSIGLGLADSGDRITPVLTTLTDGRKFNTFLKGLEQDAETNGNITHVVDLLIGELHVRQENDDDVVLFARKLVHLRGGLELLAPPESRQVLFLQRLDIAIHEKVLAEYITAENLQLYTSLDDNTVGPQFWHLTYDCFSFAAKWQQVTEYFYALAEEPRAAYLLSELLTRTKYNIRRSQEHWNRNQNDDTTEQEKTVYKEVFEAARKDIRFLQERSA